MWSRPLVKKRTLLKYKKYAEEHGIKLWKVFDEAIESLDKSKGDQ